jgi:hypothetical protein
VTIDLFESPNDLNKLIKILTSIDQKNISKIYSILQGMNLIK